jgi:hypothetical protein
VLWTAAEVPGTCCTLAARRSASFYCKPASAAAGSCASPDVDVDGDDDDVGRRVRIPRRLHDPRRWGIRRRSPSGMETAHPSNAIATSPWQLSDDSCRSEHRRMDADATPDPLPDSWRRRRRRRLRSLPRTADSGAVSLGVARPYYSSTGSATYMAAGSAGCPECGEQCASPAAAATLVAAVHIATAIVIGLVPASLRPVSSPAVPRISTGPRDASLAAQSVCRSVSRCRRTADERRSPECGRRLRLNGDRRGPEWILQPHRKTDAQTYRRICGLAAGDVRSSRRRKPRSHFRRNDSSLRTGKR